MSILFVFFVVASHILDTGPNCLSLPTCKYFDNIPTLAN